LLERLGGIDVDGRAQMAALDRDGADLLEHLARADITAQLGDSREIGASEDEGMPRSPVIDGPHPHVRTVLGGDVGKSRDRLRGDARGVAERQDRGVGLVGDDLDAAP